MSSICKNQSQAMRLFVTTAMVVFARARRALCPVPRRTAVLPCGRGRGRWAVTDASYLIAVTPVDKQV